MLGKILLLALAVWLILSIIKQYQRSLEAPKPPRPESEDMVACAACGLHIPKAESILRHGTYFCCKEHSEKPPQ